jgi:hypothetical protein
VYPLYSGQDDFGGTKPISRKWCGLLGLGGGGGARKGVVNPEARRFGEYAELHRRFSSRMALKAKAELAEEAEASPGIWFPRGAD